MHIPRARAGAVLALMTLAASPALAQDPVVHTHGSYETAGVIVSLPTGSSTTASATLEVRGPADPSFRPAHPFTRYDANNLAASLFGLEPATSYDLRIGLTTDSGTSTWLSSLTTASEPDLPSPSDSVSASDTSR